MIWKKVINNNNYEVSDTGIVRNSKGDIMRPRTDRYGYLRLKLSNCKPAQYKTVHRLVAEAFIPNNDNKPQVNHIDANRLNNNMDNLEWNTALENIHHVHKLKRNADVNGEKNPMSKLTSDDAWNIKYWHSDLSTSFLAELYGVGNETVRRIRVGESWKDI